MTSVSQATATAVTEPIIMPRHRLRLFIFRVVKGIGLTWLCAALFAFQATEFNSAAPLPHPVERLVSEGRVAVDAASLTLISELTLQPSVDLARMKGLIVGVAERLASFADTPKHWELIAELEDGYRSVRYEGRGDQGTHWVVTAYQLGSSDSVFIGLRTETRRLPDDLRLTSYQLKQIINTGVRQPLTHLDTRIVVSGRTLPGTGLPPAHYAEGLFDALGSADALRVKEDMDGVWIAGYSPYLMKTRNSPANIELHIIPEGEYTRVTVGTPYLSDVESSLSSGRPYTYTSLPYGQTMAREVR